MVCNSVLIVEDDNDLRRTIAFVLETEGYRVLTAENGQAALDMLKSLSSGELPGCIMLDLMMPVMGGREFLEILVKDHPDDLAKIHVFIATAKGNPKEDLAALPLKLDFIRKPMDIDELLNAVAKYCGRPA